MKNKKPVQLHIMHSWGGGLEHWVRDYCYADRGRINFVLKSLGIPGTPGQKIGLYQDILDEEPIQVWELTPYIHDTAIAHLGYCYLLEEIIKTYQVSTILVSSLIGHSLDALNTGLKTIFIGHDYYPFCYAINIYFHEICSRCTTDDLNLCFQHNPYNRFLPKTSPQRWEQLRQYFVKFLLKNKTPFIVPSKSVKKHLITLEPTFNLIQFFVISHGVELLNKQLATPPFQQRNSQLKILVLGSVALHKGFYLLKEIAPQVADIGEILLLGHGDEGQPLESVKGIRAIAKSYRREELTKIVETLAPDLGLLLPVWPETFNYTLSELKIMGIPTITTNVGSLSERIVDSVNGFLVSPDPHTIIAKIRELYQNQEIIHQVAKTIESEDHKSLEEMVQDYENVLQLNSTPAPLISREINLIERLSLMETITNLEKEKLSLIEIITESEKKITSLEEQIEAMESSKFWKLRKRWFKLKRLFGLPVKE